GGRVKTLLVLFLFVAGACFAQDGHDSKGDSNSPAEAKRLSSVTWDLKAHKLVWVVQTGALKDGAFKPASSQTYEISPDEAVMTFAQERRGFTPDEAVMLQRLLNTLSIYCAESVIWWDNGEGVKLDQKNEPQPHRETVLLRTAEKKDRQLSR